MKNEKVNRLPHWVITDLHPAFYDTDSSTAVEQTGRVYAKMNELIKNYNEFVDSINKHIEEFENGTNKSIEVFETEIRQEFQDFIDIIDLKIENQDKVIQDAIDYMKTNLVETIKRLNENNELDSMLVKAINDVEQEMLNKQNDFEVSILTTQNNFMNETNAKISSISNGTPLVASSTSEMTDTTRVYVNTSDGKWYYYNGSSWISGGVYQATEISESSIDSKHLNNQLSMLLKINEIPIDLEFKIGGISGSTGKETLAKNRLVSNFYKFNNTLRISIVDNYKFKLFEYNEMDESQYSKTEDWMTGVITYNPNPDKYYRFIIAKNDDSDINVSESANVSIYEKTFNYEGTEIINLSEDLKKLLNISKVNVEFEMGTISTAGGVPGAEAIADTRLRTKFFKPNSLLKITNKFNYRHKLFIYDENKNFISTKDWNTKHYYEEVCNGDNYYRVVIARTDDAVMELSESQNVSIECYSLKDENQDNFIKQSSKLFGSFGVSGYSQDSWMSGITLVDDLLLCFGTSPDDNLTYTNGLIYKIDIENKKLIPVKTFKHNFGHANSVDYCKENDSLVFGNGSGDFDLKGKFYVMENFIGRILNVENPILSLSDCIEYDCTNLDIGNEYKFNCCWGDGNLCNYDTIILVTNNFRNIRKIQLGRNNMHLGLGNYVEATNNKFNGTFKIQKEYNQDTYGAVDRDNYYCVQDLAFYDNKLYAGVGHGIRSYWIMSLKHDGTIEREEKQFDAYSSSGEECNTTGSAICVTDKYLILGTGGITIFNR